jgi:hypothetical protein
MEAMQRTIERIQKLMALAMSDPDTPEAKSAAAKAAELLAKYELDMADLTEENKNDILEESFKVYNPNDANWEQTFLVILRNVFDIHVVLDSKDQQKIYRLFGKKQDLVLCVYFFKMVRRIAIKRAELEYKTKALRNKFQCGLVASIGERFMEMKEKRQEHRTEMTSAVAVRNREDVEDHVNNLFPKLRNKRVNTKPTITTQAELNAYKRGSAVGKEIPLHTPLEGEYEMARGVL